MVGKIIAFLVLTSSIVAQESEISVQRNELSLLKKEIKQLELEIKEKSKKEKKTFATLENMKKQAYILSRMINTLRREEEQKEKEIGKSIREITGLKNEISSLKTSYAKSITGLYKYGNPSDIDLIINSENVNQALIRKNYLKRFSQKRQNDIDRLNLAITELMAVEARLVIERDEKIKLNEEKRAEESKLKNKMAENSRLITQLKKNKTELRKELDGKRKAEVKITALINKLVAEAERKRKEELERLARLEKSKNKEEKGTETTGADFDLNTAGFSSFQAMKGKLNWPLQGQIKNKFGENKNPLLNTVTLNYGVDIEARKDVNVKCVADGIVSAIDWIPGYGSVIIITHAEDYRTVYSRLSEIYVSEGEKIKAGKLIAKVGESIEGKILHFEIWSSRNNQNPEIWLARR